MDGSLSEDKKLKAMLVNAGVLIPLKKYDNDADDDDNADAGDDEDEDGDDDDASVMTLPITFRSASYSSQEV